jgi:hypothetical protein
MASPADDDYKMVGLADIIFEQAVAPLFLTHKEKIDAEFEEALYSTLYKKYPDFVGRYPIVAKKMCQGMYKRNAFVKCIDKVKAVFGKGNDSFIDAHASYIDYLYKEVQPNMPRKIRMELKSLEAELLYKNFKIIRDKETNVNRELDREDKANAEARRSELAEFLDKAGRVDNNMTTEDLVFLEEALGVVPDGSYNMISTKDMTEEQLLGFNAQLRAYELQLCDEITAAQEQLERLTLNPPKRSKKKRNMPRGAIDVTGTNLDQKMFKR